MDEIPLEAVAGDLLIHAGKSLAVAESCTGGLIGHRVTNIPGSSAYYRGSVTAYANEAKVHLLQVKAETLEKFGAVSQETVLEMAAGVRLTFAADIGLSVSGIAGPGGGTLEKPVGTVWIGLSAPDCHQAWHFDFPGSRLQVKERTAEQALRLLIEYLRLARSR